MRDECSKYGKILELKIPRPAGGSRQSAGVGRIFVKFETIEATTNALTSLAGRKFADRTVVTTYFPEVSNIPCIDSTPLQSLNAYVGKLRRRSLVKDTGEQTDNQGCPAAYDAIDSPDKLFAAREPAFYLLLLKLTCIVQSFFAEKNQEIQSRRCRLISRKASKLIWVLGTKGSGWRQKIRDLQCWEIVRYELRVY